jgi:hypothetical protein
MEIGRGLGRFQSKFQTFFQKLDLLPPKQFQRFATLLFYVYFNIRKGEGDFLYKSYKQNKVSFYSKKFSFDGIMQGADA